MPFLERAGTKLFYEREGDTGAPTVTLVNGYSRSSSDFRSFSRFLASNGYQVLRLDNRGSGLTTNAPGFTVAEMASDIVDLWAHCGVARSHLLGISYGGVLSILLSSQHPEKVASLTLVSTTPSSFFLSLDNNLSAQAPEEVEANLARYFSDKFRRENAILFKSLLKETSKAFLDPQARARSAEQRSALKQFDFTALLHSIACPTLILHGTADGVVDPDAAEVLSRAIKKNTFELVPDVGHLFLAECPKFFFDRVLRFIKEQG